MSLSLHASADRLYLSSAASRAILVVAGACALAAGFAVTGVEAAHQAAEQAGPDLTRLMRAMALIKVGLAAGLLAGMYWRLAAPVRPAWLAAYGAAVAAMAAGPAMIWDMAHVTAGAVLLHAGLLSGIVMLWRDPASARLLADALAVRGRTARNG